MCRRTKDHGLLVPSRESWSALLRFFRMGMHLAGGDHEPSATISEQTFLRNQMYNYAISELTTSTICSMNNATA